MFVHSMWRAWPASTACGSCRAQVLALFTESLCWRPQPQARSIRASRSSRTSQFSQNCQSRTSHFIRAQQQNVQVEASEDSQHGSMTASQEYLEFIARGARQTFGETLPPDLLSSQEYAVYERLYGPPLHETSAEDTELLKPLQEDLDEPGFPENMLLKENEDGELEEIYFTEEPSTGADKDMASWANPEEEDERELKARMTLYRDIAAARETSRVKEETMIGDSHAQGAEEEFNHYKTANHEVEGEYDEDARDLEEDGGRTRTHPYTAAGKFSTSPATISLPRDTFVEPIKSLLADASSRHLVEVAHATFGGPGFPNSTATPSSKHHLRQQPVALEASQTKMGEMEANVYLGAIMPGVYAAVMSTLVETRKRLGSGWLAGLLRKPGGPRILDFGSAGAAVLAWRDVLRAEWERMHPDGTPEHQQYPVGKATVVVGSAELRRRASSLLENTTFIPRLPDYFPARDLPIAQDGEAPSRKQYDVILAPHTLWTLKEDHMRKAQVQNLWSLLDPNGGVLIVIEKGVPRGFELVANAREVLLKNQISSPGSRHIENELQGTATTRYTEKEEGMIVAPCTNHAQCPMYLMRGQNRARKSYCHFSQRYARPSFLQHLLGAKDRNHEDIRFSYIALRRGQDLRRQEDIQQGEAATDVAFEGYSGHGEGDGEDAAQWPPGVNDSNAPNMLSLPRVLLPPLKRQGHVILDLCTPAGKFERWIVARSSSKQAYRDARKSRWGDLWALGAKTRVPRMVEAGKGHGGKRPKQVIEVGVGADESEDRIRVKPGKEAQYEKRTKRGRAKRRPRVLTEDDF